MQKIFSIPSDVHSGDKHKRKQQKKQWTSEGNYDSRLV
jgi:hypothetical protein